MDMIEWLSLVAGLMTTGAPITQALKTFRTRNYTGLSVESYLLLLCLGTFAVLVGVQYGILTMTTLNAIGLSANMLIMLMLSRTILAAYLLTLAALAGMSWLVVPSLFLDLFTTRWAEQVAFIYGVIAAATFLPQVLLTRRTRVVSALSVVNLALFAGGMVIWIGVSIMLGNYSLTGWNIILLFMISELLRLKITVERHQDVAANADTLASSKPAA
jgi:uncharacterized protein with PQ loop repeat